MSLYDYHVSREIEAKDYPFYSLIMAAMRQADDRNLVLLKAIFPKVWKEIKARYHAPGGVLPGESLEDIPNRAMIMYRLGQLHSLELPPESKGLRNQISRRTVPPRPRPGRAGDQRFDQAGIEE